MKDQRVWSFLALMIVALGLSYPFLGQPLSIDDPFTVWLGRAIEQMPLRPYLAESYWYDEPASLFEDFRNPPLVGYYSYLVRSLAGETEYAFHMLFLPFSVLCAWGLYSFSRGFVRTPLSVTIIFLSIPTVMIQSHHIMPDMMCLSLFLAGLSLFRLGCDQNRPGLLGLAGLCGGLCSLAKYQGLLWLIVICLYVYYLKPSVRFRRWGLAPLIALVCQAVWMIDSLLVYGRWHLWESCRLGGPDLQSILVKTAVLICHSGGNLLCLLVLVRASWGRLLGTSLVLTVVSTALLANFYEIESVRELVMPVIFLFSGLIILTCCLIFSIAEKATAISGQTEGLAKFLKAWIILGMVSTVVSTPFMASRFLLLWFAPIILLLFKQLRFGESGRWSVPSVRIALIGTVLLGTLISISAYHFSQSGKTLANMVIRDLNGQKVIFTGHWGFQYYLTEAGFSPYWSGLDPAGSTFLVVADQFSGQRVPHELMGRTLPIEHYRLKFHFPIMVMDQSSFTSHYIHYAGPLPWNCARSEPIEVRVYQVFPEISRVRRPNMRGPDAIVSRVNDQKKTGFTCNYSFSALK
ncbi:glycosyltransferase family 39 protein [bacterium]|nr:glycosyltransferase family 39 protein [bacterium]